MSPGPYVTVKNHSMINHSVNFLKYWMQNKKTAVLRIGAAKTKSKAIQKRGTLWYRIHNRRGHTKIIKIVKNALYNWVLHYPQVVQYPIVNG